MIPIIKIALIFVEVDALLLGVVVGTVKRSLRSLIQLR